MSDIVERIREVEAVWDRGESTRRYNAEDLIVLVPKAWLEIESLRKEVTSWKDLYECTSAKDKALIETLGKQVEEWKARWSQENSEHAETIAAAKHEIAELEKERGYDPVTISETTMNKYRNAVIDECIDIAMESNSPVTEMTELKR